MALDTLARAMAARADSKAKTAYQYAVEGGYTGTEEQFTEDMGKLGINAEVVDNAVRFDIEQSKTALQKLQAQANIGLDTTDGDINAQLALRALITGYYEAMGVGTADNLTSSQKATDTEPYNYRTTGGSADVGSQENFKSLVGGTLALNQLIPIPASDISKTENGVTFKDNRDGTYTVSTDENGATADTDLYLQTAVNNISGHIYWLQGTPSGGSFNTYFLQDGWSGQQEYGNGRIFKSTQIKYRISIKVRSGVVITTPIVFKPQFVNMTVMFGTIPQNVGGTNYNSIADYLPDISSSAKAWLYKYFPKLNGGYIPYSAPTLSSVCCDKHITNGLNQEPKSAVLGTVWAADGTLKTGQGNNYFGTDSKIRWKPSTPLVVSIPKLGNGAYLYIAEFDINKQFIQRSAYITVSQDDKYGEYTPSANCYYIGWSMWRATEFTATEASEVCVALAYDGEMNGVYEEYKVNTYDMGHETLRGIYMLDSFGNLFLDPSKNDTKTPDGEITRRRGSVNLGLLSWDYSSTSGYFYGYVSNLQNQVANTVGLAICEKYTATTFGALCGGTAPDKTIGLTNGGNNSTVYIKDTSYNGDAVAFKTAMNGVYLEYPLDTPTTESGTEYTELQKCHNWGTEELKDYEVGQGNRVVSIPVGHVTEYPVDLKAKVEMLPSAPLTDGDYLCRVANGKAEFVPIGSEFPEAPTEDGTYALKATVSSGAATLSWVAEE